jgi:hypothetical protein
LKSGKSGIHNQLDAIKAKIEREQNELKLKKGKINYRNTDEIDREIKYPHPHPPVPVPISIDFVCGTPLTLGIWNAKSIQEN